MHVSRTVYHAPTGPGGGVRSVQSVAPAGGRLDRVVYVLSPIHPGYSLGILEISSQGSLPGFRTDESLSVLARLGAMGTAFWPEFAVNRNTSLQVPGNT